MPAACQTHPTCRYNEVVLVTAVGNGKVAPGHRGPREIQVDRSPSSSYPVFHAPRMPTKNPAVPSRMALAIECRIAACRSLHPRILAPPVLPLPRPWHDGADSPANRLGGRRAHG